MQAVKSFFSHAKEILWRKAVWIIGAAYSLVGFFSLIKTEFLPDTYRSWKVIQILPHWSWRTWVIGFLVLVVVLAIEGSRQFHVKREKRVEEEKLTIERAHKIETNGLAEQIGRLKVELATEKNGVLAVVAALVAQANQLSPQLFLKYEPSAAAQAHSYSGLFVGNSGSQAFTVELSTEPRNDVGLTFLEMPIQTLDTGKKVPIKVTTMLGNHPIGGTLGRQIERFLEELSTRGEAERTLVMIKYRDYHDKEYVKQWAIMRAARPERHIWCESA